MNLGMIDEVIPEPLGGAHADWDAAAGLLKQAIVRHLAEVSKLHWNDRTHARYDKFRKMGFFQE
jgi:acetyl-CoA carboxylase carboxyl transferase subunit alpha